MTRIAVLCDIHGNLPALEAVVPELEVDLVVLGGDVASGPFPAETLQLLRSLPVPVRFVRGNADRVLDLEGIPEPNRSARLWVAERLGEENLRFLAGLPLDLVSIGSAFATARRGAIPSRSRGSRRRAGSGRCWRGSPSVSSSAAIRTCSSTGTVDGMRVLNAGSVGAPYEAEPAAYWLELDTRSAFSPNRLRRRGSRRAIRASGYPNRAPLDHFTPDPERPERMSRLIEAKAA